MGPGMAAFCSAAPSPKARKNARHLSQVKHGAAAQLPAGPASSPLPRRDPSLPLGMSHLPHREQRPTHRLLPDGDAGMRTRTIDLTLSILASTADRKSTRLTPVTNAHLVCRLLLEKKNNSITKLQIITTTDSNRTDNMTL